MSGININLDAPGYGNDPSIFGGFTFNSKYGAVPAYCYDSTRVFIKEKLKNIKHGIFVEIGVFGGSTLLDIYDLCSSNNIMIYGIDPWDKIKIFNGKSFEETNENIRNQEINRYKSIRENLENIISTHNLNIKLFNDNSWEVYNNFEDNSISCIHIDGDHSYEGVKKDLQLYWPKIKKGGLVINDDYHWGGCKKAINEFINEHKSEIKEFYPIVNGEKNVIVKL